MTAATIEIAITPPGASTPWWTIFWDSLHASVRTAPGLAGDSPEDWGLRCTAPAYTDAWRAEGGTPYVVEQILDACAGAGSQADIVAIHGTPDARRRTLAALAVFVEENPGCAAELRRVVADSINTDR